MSGKEDESRKTVSPGSPLPPPFPDFLFSKILQVPKLIDCDVENEASSFEEAVKRLTDAEGCLQPKPFYSVNTHLQPQLQQGPKCGLVALSMATTMTGDFKSADELFDEAVKMGFTTQGEMYSAENLAALAETSTKFKKFALNSGIGSHVDCIFHCIQSGGLMLVPHFACRDWRWAVCNAFLVTLEIFFYSIAHLFRSYDADYNHKPCCRKGHSAHWAVISGLVVFNLRDAEEEEGGGENKNCASSREAISIMTNPGLYPECQCVKSDTENFFKSEPNEVKILRRSGDIYFTGNGGDVRNAKKCKLYLAGRQGKSKHLALWPLEALAESNDNLAELSESQKDKNFTLPTGGVSSGLKDRKP